MKEYLQENHGRVIKMLNYEITQEQWIRIHKRDGEIEKGKKMAKKMFLNNKPIEEIREYTEIEDYHLKDVLAELPQEIQEKYKLVLK